MEYLQLAESYGQLEKTSKRLEKTFVLSSILKKADDEDLSLLSYLLQGKVFPIYDQRKIGISSRLMLKALATSTGIKQSDVERMWKTTGDLGTVAEELIKKRAQKTLFSKHLTIKKVFENIQKIAEISGGGAVNRKIQLISELLNSATPLEAKFIVRTVLEQLRAGVAEGTLRDAIVWAFLPRPMGIFFRCKKCGEINPKTETCLHCNSPLYANFQEETKNARGKFCKSFEEIKKEKELYCKDEQTAREIYNKISTQVQEAYDLSADFGIVALKAKKEGLRGLKEVPLVAGKPIKVMLFQKALSFEDAFETVGKPAAIEWKYDGFRLVITCNKENIKLFTRRLEDVTTQFPDVVAVVKNQVHSSHYILDSEVIGFDPHSGKWLPFQNISQRIKRKYNIQEMIKKIPVIVNVFDAMMVDGKNLLNKPFKERRKLIEHVVKIKKNSINVADHIITDDIAKAKVFYKKSLEMGNEGVMVKNLEGIYKPGSRVGYGVKLKEALETLDLAIVSAEWGEGKRSGWLSTYVLALQDKKGKLRECGMMGTGIKEKKEKEEDVTFEEITTMLKKSIIKEEGKMVFVKPSLVVEVRYEEIQKSPTYDSGYALRFPRLVRLRYDKSIHDVSTINEVEKIYHEQRGRI